MDQATIESWWDRIPSNHNYLSVDENGIVCIYVRKPHTGDTEWLEPRYGCNFTSLQLRAEICDHLSGIPWHLTLIQRPESFTGIISKGDILTMATGEMLLVQATNPDDIDQFKAPEDDTIYHVSNSIAVNGIAINGATSKPVAPNKQAGIPPEVHNQQPIDTELALDAMRNLCRGHQ